MPYSIALTAIVPPRRRADILSRARLLDQLYDLLEYRLIVLSAPAGYGKTSLLIDFVRSQDVLACWYTIDHADDNLIGFLMHLVAAVQQQFPEVGKTTAAILSEADRADFNLDLLITPLVNDLQQAAQDHFVIILDDYHLVNHNKRISAFISRFVQRTGDYCHVIVAGRKQPALPEMELLTGRSLLRTIDARELLFTDQEIQNLIRQNYQVAVSNEEARKLAQATGGWITALLLSAQGDWRAILDHVQATRIGGVGLCDYLLYQVLEQQSQEMQDFLLYSSLLGDFNADLCRAVLGTTVYPPETDWLQLIEMVLRDNLLVTQVGERETWLRYHHLFQEFLQKQMTTAHPEQVSPVLQALGAECETRGEWERAYDVYQRLGDQERLIAMIERSGTPMIKQGKFHTLSRWLGEMSLQIVNERPQLISLQGTITAMGNDLGRAISLFDRAIGIFRIQNDSANLCRALVRRSISHHFLGNYLSSLNDSQMAIDTITQDGINLASELMAEALRSKGINLVYWGDPSEGLAYLNQSLLIYQNIEDRNNLALVYQDIGIAQRSLCHHSEARKAYEQALTIRLDIGDQYKAASIYNNLGVVEHFDGNYSNAFANFNKVVELSQSLQYTRMEVYGWLGLCDLYLDLGLINEGQHAHRQVFTLTPKLHGSNLILYTHLAGANIARLQKNWAVAEDLLESAQRQLHMHSPDYERGLCSLESGRQLSERDQMKKAVNYFEAAVSFFDQAHKDIEAARAYLLWANAYHALGNPADRDILRKAFARAACVESDHALVVVGSVCSRLLNDLSKDPELCEPIARLQTRIHLFERQKPILWRHFRHSTAMESAQLIVKAFGEGQISLQGKIIADTQLKYTASKEIFFYTLNNPDGLRRDKANLIFWPDDNPEQFSRAWRNALYRLRKFLGQNIFEDSDERLLFNFGLDYWYDVEEFQHLVLSARTNPEEKPSLLDKAVHLYTTPFLLDISHEWVVPIREKLRQSYVHAILDLGKMALNNREFDAGLEYGWMALTIEPDLEPIHRLVMEIYAKMGHRADAIRQYHICRQALADHLQISPDEETNRLFRRLTR